MTGIQIKGLESIPSKLQSLVDEKKASVLFREIVLQTADLIKEYAPRDLKEEHARRHPDLPHLENAIHVKQIGENKFIITIEVPYASYPEFGTRYINVGTVDAPKNVVSGSGKLSFRPYIRPAVRQMMRVYGQKLPEIFKI